MTDKKENNQPVKPVLKKAAIVVNYPYSKE